MKILCRLSLLTVAALALVPAAHAATDGGGAPAGAPKGLKAFLLRVDEPALHSFPRTPSFSWTPQRGVDSYTFQLSTSRAFTPSGVIWQSGRLAIPAVSIPIALPWITGNPYSLYARIRSVSHGAPSQWSAPYGFNMRWPNVPTPETSYPGLVRWSPVEGATAYEVWLYGAMHTFFTTSNVADERDMYTFHSSPSWTASVNWRVRAVRTLYGTLPNGLPRTSVGPWSPIYTAYNPPFNVGDLQATAAVSDVVSTAGHPLAHQLTPGFVWTGATRTWGDPWYVTTAELFHVYVFTDKDCVNPVYVSAVVGSPAYAPRMNATLKLPATASQLADARVSYLDYGAEGLVYTLSGRKITATEANGSIDDYIPPAAPATGTGSGSGGTTDPSATLPKIDLWDAAWPNGGYYWTVVPTVVVQSRTSPGTLEYQDLETAQDACQSGHVGGVLRFGKVSQPVTTGGARPYISGLSPSGRLLAASKKRPTVYGAPLIAWEPARGANAYEVQWSRTTYPWAPAGKITTYSTSASPRLKPGVWYYRVRGLDYSLPGSAPEMSWSLPVPIQVAKPIFKIVSR